MSQEVFYILAINPGSTSTKLTVYENEKPLFQKTVYHSARELSSFDGDISAQYEYRKEQVLKYLAQSDFDLAKLSAVVGRGGLLKPIEGGVYLIDERVIEDALIGVQGQHASNLGVQLAKGIADNYGVPSFFVDPPSVDEFEPLARLSGLPELPRRSILHALNLKAVGRRMAGDIGRKFEDLNLILTHLGGGISVVASRRGRFIDGNNATEEGPFSPERSGHVPVRGLIQLCYSGKYNARELDRKLVGQGGLVAYLGTNDASEVEKRVKSGDAKARLVFEAMAYQVSKEIGAMACVLAGKVDYIVLTGGLAFSEIFTGWVRGRTHWIAPVLVYPGEEEMRAMVEGALRVLRGEEKPRVYP
ncbi:butyrate kinase [Moorella stamsii]|nr:MULTISPECIES: butyrate kinase [Moorella]